MQQTDQFERYKNEQPSFFQAIRDMEVKHNTSIINKMKERRYDFDSFRGIMVEVEYGLFLDQFAENLEYEPNIDGKTPDWLASINGHNVIVEVARLKDSQEIEQQMQKDHQSGTIGFHVLGSKPQRLYNNVISRKTNKYIDLLQSNGYSFIIGIYNTPVSGVRISDAAQLLHGRSIKYQYSGHIEVDRTETIFYSESFPDTKSVLNGVLWLNQPSFDPILRICEPNKFIYWHNENANRQFGKIEILHQIAGSYD